MTQRLHLTRDKLKFDYEQVAGNNPDLKCSTSKTLNSVFQCTIEVESHTSLKNKKIIGYKWNGKHSAKRPFLRTEARTKAAQDFLVLALLQRARAINFDKPLGVPLRSLWTLQFANYWTKGKPIRLNRKAGDLTNSIQGCEDALTKAFIIEDDSLIVEMHAKKIPSPDGQNRITVELFELA